MDHLRPQLIKDELSTLLASPIRMKVPPTSDYLKDHLVFTSGGDTLDVTFTYTMWATTYFINQEEGIFTHPQIKRILDRAAERTRE